MGTADQTEKRKDTGEVTIRLYSELKGWICGDEEDIILSARSLKAYQEQLGKAVEEAMEYAGEGGLARYLNSPELKRKVVSMKPGVESWKDELWGFLEVKSRGPLSEKEVSQIRSEWSGQLTDGWGEGFVQREIDSGDGYSFCVDFCAGKMRPLLLTEEELKGKGVFLESSEQLSEKMNHGFGMEFSGK